MCGPLINYNIHDDLLFFFCLLYIEFNLIDCQQNLTVVFFFFFLNKILAG